MGSPFIGTICNSLLGNSLGVRVRNGGPVIPVGDGFKETKAKPLRSFVFFCPHVAYKSKLLTLMRTKKAGLTAGFFSLAENVGFEPTVPCGTTVFKTAAIDHSANSPRQK